MVGLYRHLLYWKLRKSVFCLRSFVQRSFAFAKMVKFNATASVLWLLSLPMRSIITEYIPFRKS